MGKGEQIRVPVLHPRELPRADVIKIDVEGAEVTSSGYGDLTPATRSAESLVILEQIAGVFYVAVLIGRIAGLYPPSADRPK